jgi:hypothetical protein
MRDPAHLDRWRTAADRFLSRLAGSDLLDRVVVNAVPWAERDEDGRDPSTGGLRATEFNDLIVPYYDHLAAQGVTIARVAPEEVIARIDHKWGRAPFHFVDETYRAMQRSFQKAISDVGIQRRHE